MKVYCNECGCHFPKEFKVTLKTPCNWWGSVGLSNLPTDYKLKIWNWLFMLPSDEIGLKFKIGLGIQLSANPIEEKYQFNKMVRGWDKMSEKKRQEFEKNYFKNQGKLKPTLKADATAEG